MELLAGSVIATVGSVLLMTRILVIWLLVLLFKMLILNHVLLRILVLISQHGAFVLLYVYLLLLWRHLLCRL